MLRCNIFAWAGCQVVMQKPVGLRGRQARLLGECDIFASSQVAMVAMTFQLPPMVNGYYNTSHFQTPTIYLFNDNLTFHCLEPRAFKPFFGTSFTPISMTSLTTVLTSLKATHFTGYLPATKSGAIWTSFHPIA